MRQRAFQLTEAQACEMQGAYHNCQDAQTRTRYQAVRLYGQGYPTREIEAICGCSRSSLMEWCRSYREAGVTGLVDQRVGGNRALLTPHQLERLQYLLGSHTPRQLFGVAGCVGTGQFWSVGDLAQLIQREFDSATRARPPIASCSTSAASAISARRSSTSRARHSRSPSSKNSLKKLIDTTQNTPESVIVAPDEASRYLQATLQAVWHWRGEAPVVKLHPGHDCVHFYGSLNLLTGEEIVTRTTVMKAETTALHIQQVLAAYPDKPMLMLLDRASWHHGPAIDALSAANPRLELLYFPTAAPDLNPQEHVWKAARENVGHNHLGAKLSQLATDFETYLKTTKFASPLLANHDYQRLCAMSK